MLTVLISSLVPLQNSPQNSFVFDCTLRGILEYIPDLMILSFLSGTIHTSDSGDYHNKVGE